MTYNIYLGGHVDETDKPREWREGIKNQYGDDPGLEFIDPVEKFPKYDDNEREVVWWCITQAVICDGLFVKWDNETLTVGTIVEITIAFLFHNPVIVWYEEGHKNEVSPFLRVLAVDIYKGSYTCMDQLKHEMKQFTKTPW